MFNLILKEFQRRKIDRSMIQTDPTQVILTNKVLRIQMEKKHLTS